MYNQISNPQVFYCLEGKHRVRKVPGSGALSDRPTSRASNSVKDERTEVRGEDTRHHSTIQLRVKE